MFSSYKKYAVEKLTYMSGPRVFLLFSSVLLAFIFVICLGASAAWSSENPRAQNFQQNGFLDFKAFSLKSEKSPPVLTDQCLPCSNPSISPQAPLQDQPSAPLALPQLLAF